jgi:hypothetical protein
VKDCPPFKAGEFYPADQGYQCIDDTITIWVDDVYSDAVSFTPAEVEEYFVGVDLD